MACGGVDDARGLHLIFDAAILVEIPIGGIFVIADRRDGGNHQTPRAANFRSLAAHVVVLPGQAGIFLMQADASFDRSRIAEHVGNDRVEIMDVAQAVAAELQRVRHPAEAEFTIVEHVLAVVGPLGRAIGHHHLGDRRAIQDRPALAVVGISDGVEDQPLPAAEADAEIPILPGDLVAFDNKARPFRLHDLQRARGLAEIGEKLPRHSSAASAEPGCSRPFPRNDRRSGGSRAWPDR